MGKHKDEVMRSRVGKRQCTHPRVRDRRQRALTQREEQLDHMVNGLMPVPGNNPGDPYCTADYYEARYGDPAVKIQRAEDEIFHLQVKLGINPVKS